MFLKFAKSDVLEAKIAHSGDGLLKSAHKATFDYEPREGYLYVRSRAISSRTNDNFDSWPAGELRQAWATFIGKPVFVNHHNEDVRRKRGVIIDACLHEDTAPDGTEDVWIEVLMEIDAINFPMLAKAILAGDIERTSMGADVGESVCSYCGNVATTPSTYCEHIKHHKGQRLLRMAADGTREEVLVHEECRKISFFENSVLVEPPADPTAFVVGVDSNGVEELLNMPPRSAVANRGNDGRGHTELGGDVLQGDLASSGASRTSRSASRQAADLDHFSVSELRGGVPNPLGAPPATGHVGRVLGEGAQQPMGGVVAQRGVAGVPNNQSVRDRAHERLVAPAVGSDGTALGIVQRQASVPVGEGASGPRPAGGGSARGIDLRQVPVHDRLGSLESAADHVEYLNLGALTSEVQEEMTRMATRRKHLWRTAAGSKTYTVVQPGVSSTFEMHIAGCGDLSSPKYQMTTKDDVSADSVDQAMSDFLDDQMREQGYSESDFKVFPCARSGIPVAPKAVDPDSCPMSGQGIDNPKRLMRMQCPSCNKFLGTGSGRWPKHKPVSKGGSIKEATLVFFPDEDGDPDDPANDGSVINIGLVDEDDPMSYEVLGTIVDWGGVKTLRIYGEGEMSIPSFSTKEMVEQWVTKQFARRKISAIESTAGTQAESDELLARTPAEIRDRVAKIIPSTVYGPGYNRNATENVYQAVRFAQAGNFEHAEIFLRKAESQVYFAETGVWIDPQSNQTQMFGSKTAGAWDYGPTTPGPDAGTRWEGIISLPNSAAYKVVVRWPGDEVPMLSAVLDSEERAQEWAQKCVEAGADDVTIENAGTFQRIAYGETKAPPKVNTLGMVECPVCSSTNNFDTTGRCTTCGHLPAPEPFRQPDLEVAQKVDMRDGWVNPDLLAAPAFVPPDEAADGEENDPTDPVRPVTSARKEVEGVEGDTMRPSEAIIARTAEQLRRATAENAVLRRRLAGQRTADADNPAQPVPEPAASGATQSTDDTRAPDTTTEVTSPGAALTDVAADGTTDVTAPGAAITDVAADATTDVTSPVSGTQDPVPYDQSVTLVQPDASGASNGTDKTNAFGDDNSWVQASVRTATARTYACIRLARLRIEAGLATGDDLALAQQIQASKVSDEALRTEISTLAAVRQVAPQRTASAGPRRETRAVPGITSVVDRQVTAASGSSFGVSSDEVLW